MAMTAAERQKVSRERRQGPDRDSHDRDTLPGRCDIQTLDRDIVTSEAPKTAREAMAGALRQAAKLSEQDRERMRREYGPYFAPRQQPFTSDECANFWAIMQRIGAGRRIGKAAD